MGFVVVNDRGAWLSTKRRTVSNAIDAFVFRRHPNLKKSEKGDRWDELKLSGFNVVEVEDTRDIDR